MRKNPVHAAFQASIMGRHGRLERIIILDVFLTTDSTISITPTSKDLQR